MQLIVLLFWLLQTLSIACWKMSFIIGRSFTRSSSCGFRSLQRNNIRRLNNPWASQVSTTKKYMQGDDSWNCTPVQLKNGKQGIIFSKPKNGWFTVSITNALTGNSEVRRSIKGTIHEIYILKTNHLLCH